MNKVYRISFQEILGVIIFLVVLALGDQMLSIDGDLGRHIAFGNYILNTGTIPTYDIFSHTLNGESRPPYEWLSQVGFAIFNNLLGLDGVILLTSTMIAITMMIIFHYCLRRSQSPLFVFLFALLTAAASSIHWLPRPHIITFLLLAIWLEKLEQVRLRNKINLYTFPLMMLLWVNLHGGFIFGFLALGAYLTGSFCEWWRKKSANLPVRDFLQIGLLAFPASILTPDLWRNWEAVLNNRSAFILSRTVETMPPDFSNPSTIPFVILLALAVMFALTNRRNVSSSHIFLLSGLGVSSLLMARNIPLFAIASAPILAEWISERFNTNVGWKKFDARFANFGSVNRSPVLSILLLAVAVGYFSFSRTQGRQVFQFNPQVFPVQAVDWLEENPIEGNMFNEFNWGGYLLYRTWSRHLVFLDSQSDFYGESLVRDYETILLARNNWQSLLGNYDVNWVIVPANSPLVIALSSDSGWSIAYEDNVAIILTRK